MKSRLAFTFIEVLLILLVIGVGVFGSVGVVAYGMRLASVAQAQSIGMATAVSVANDPRPLLAPTAAGDWSYAPYDFDALGDAESTATGYINGLYVNRHESTTAADIAARSVSASAHVYARSALIEVTVYEAMGGQEIASFVTRVTRQRGTP
jgi:Tfp pilus assembly protein PilV